MKRASLLFSLLAFGCDRSAPVVVQQAAPSKPVLQITSLAQALPARGASIAIDTLGNYYWTQPTDDGKDTVYVASASAMPRPTRLTSENILARMREYSAANTSLRLTDDPKQGPASGNILGLVGGPAGEVYFYFSGSRRHQSHICLGMFDGKTGDIRILADTDRLQLATGLGKSLLLADARLLRAGNTVYLWVRHTDASIVLSINPRSVSGGAQTPLTRVLETIRPKDLADLTIELNSPNITLAGSYGDDLILTDAERGTMWRVDPAGLATPVRSLIGMPHDFSPPFGTRRGDVVTFVAPSAAIMSTDPLAAPPVFVQMHFPALVRFGTTDVTSIQRDDLRSPAGFPAYAMRLEQIIETREPEVFLAYDANSGQILRLKVELQ